MSKKRAPNYDLSLVEALKSLPNPIIDKKHNISIFIEDTKARSNQSRFEHIARHFHELRVKDIEIIFKSINKNPIFKKDKTRKDTYNYLFPRKNDKNHYLKMSILVKDYKDRTAVIKTIFITKTPK